MKEWTKVWLQERIISGSGYEKYADLITIEGDERTAKTETALKELVKGLHGFFGTDNRICENDENAESGICLSLDRALGTVSEEAFCLNAEEDRILIRAGGEAGLLYGVFALLREIGTGKQPKDLSEAVQIPKNPLRMLNHWDNMTGDIERGYAGESFFFVDGEIETGERIRDYARITASVGINAVVINNVNVKGSATELITDRFLDQLAEMAEIFSDYSIRLFLSINYAAPMELGGLPDCDPLNPDVKEWWKKTTKHVYEKIPMFGGYLVKADSEGRPGPFTYGRTQADGANMLASVLEEYHSILIWRCFVYNCRQDWRDTKTDRAKAGYEAFMPLDGTYSSNVILQIKNGPMDFQIREPVSPLLGGLKRTNQMLEVQIAQEYTGHQIDVCYLIPMFKEVLDFDTDPKEEGKGLMVRDIISKGALEAEYSGIAAVANTGNDRNWTGGDLAAANWYGFGRLAWDPDLSSEEIAEEWIRLTYGSDPKVLQVLKEILMQSRETYEMYTSPLGIGWMVTPNIHYGCSVDGYEYSKWGTYHRADHHGIGVDRSSNGTGYVQQYQGKNAEMYDSILTCPEELLLFFHRVSYQHRLKSGKTLIQYIYDTHFEGYERVCRMKERFEELRGKLDPEAYERILERMELQKENAAEWRDQINTYFHRISDIEDEKGRKIYP